MYLCSAHHQAALLSSCTPAKGTQVQRAATAVPTSCNIWPHLHPSSNSSHPSGHCFLLLVTLPILITPLTPSQAEVAWDGDRLVERYLARCGRQRLAQALARALKEEEEQAAALNAQATATQQHAGVAASGSTSGGEAGSSSSSGTQQQQPAWKQQPGGLPGGPLDRVLKVGVDCGGGSWGAKGTLEHSVSSLMCVVPTTSMLSQPCCMLAGSVPRAKRSWPPSWPHAGLWSGHHLCCGR
jgi:hypothetical protein